MSRPPARPPRTKVPGRVADRTHADGRPAAPHAVPVRAHPGRGARGHPGALGSRPGRAGGRADAALRGRCAPRGRQRRGRGGRRRRRRGRGRRHPAVAAHPGVELHRAPAHPAARGAAHPSRLRPPRRRARAGRGPGRRRDRLARGRPATAGDQAQPAHLPGMGGFCRERAARLSRRRDDRRERARGPGNRARRAGGDGSEPAVRANCVARVLRQRDQRVRGDASRGGRLRGDSGNRPPDGGAGLRLHRGRWHRRDAARALDGLGDRGRAVRVPAHRRRAPAVGAGGADGPDHRHRRRAERDALAHDDAGVRLRLAVGAQAGRRPGVGGRGRRPVRSSSA